MMSQRDHKNVLRTTPGALSVCVCVCAWMCVRQKDLGNWYGLDNESSAHGNMFLFRHTRFNSAVQILYEIVESYHARNVMVYFVRLRERPMAMFEKSGLLDLVGQDHFFQKVSHAIEVVEKDMAKRGIFVQ